MNILNKKFNRWTVLSRSGFANTQKQATWNCVCDCGTLRIVTGCRLRNGGSKSCGCLKKELTIKRNTTHGMSKTRIYKIWKLMKDRCENPNNKAYKRYGGRGITVCKEWHVVGKFIEDMLPSYKSNLEIDRIKNNEGYSKNNCRWATRTQQNNNTSANVNITFKNETLSVSQWAHKLKMPVITLWSRLYRYKWTIPRAITTPIRKMHYK